MGALAPKAFVSPECRPSRFFCPKAASPPPSNLDRIRLPPEQIGAIAAAAWSSRRGGSIFPSASSFRRWPRLRLLFLAQLHRLRRHQIPILLHLFCSNRLAHERREGRARPPSEAPVAAANAFVATENRTTTEPMQRVYPVPLGPEPWVVVAVDGPPAAAAAAGLATWSSKRAGSICPSDGLSPLRRPAVPRRRRTVAGRGAAPISSVRRRPRPAASSLRSQLYFWRRREKRRLVRPHLQVGHPPPLARLEC